MTIYVRTTLGQNAAFGKSSELPRKQRALLMAVDGKTTLAMYKRSLQAFGDVDVQLAQLHDEGLLTISDEDAGLDGAQPPAGASAFERAGQSGSAYGAAQALAEVAHAGAAMSPAESFAAPVSSELEHSKLALVRDVTDVLGADGEMVVTKIQRCQNADDLFTTFMGVRKIISLYVDQRAADKFAARHLHLA